MTYTIGQIAEIIDGDRGKNYPQQADFSAQGFCLFLNTGNVTTEGFSFAKNQFISQEKDFQLRKGKLLRGDIVYTTRGTVGNAALYDDSIPYEHLRINSGMVILRCHEEVTDRRLLYQILKSDRYRPYFKSFCTGSAQPQLPIKNFSQIKIDLPPLETQRRIADILSAYDDLIKNNQKQIKLLEEAAHRLYKEWFIDLHFPGYETTPIINGIPEGWTTNALSDLFLTARGVSYSSADLEKSDDGVLLVNLKNIKAWGGYNRRAEKSYTGKYRESQTLCAGDIIMAVTDMTQGRRVVGHVAIVPTLNRTATFSMDIIKIIPKPNYTTNFLYAILRYSEIAEQISKHANGTNVLHLSPNCFDTISVIVPPQRIRKRFEDLINNTYLLKDKLEMQNFLAKEACDRLLPKLMSGQIEV